MTAPEETNAPTLSFWAWGAEEALPSEAERREMAGHLGLLTGWRLPAPLPYPGFDPGRVPAPRIEIPASLAGFCTADRRERAGRARGKAFPDLVAGFEGDFSTAPDVVARPRGEADIAAVLAFAAESGVAVVPFGGGTSVAGGVTCDGAGYSGVICLDLRGMDRVLEVIPQSLHARVQAGATGPRLEEQLAPHGLTLRHYPQSFEFSTVGGWIATRAGGHFATNYTHIDDLVAGVRLVTPAGAWEARRLPGSGAGPEPDRLALGSEGILGVITEAWLRVFPRPRFRSRAAVRFAGFEAGVEAARLIAQARLFPANCRLLDAREALLHQTAVGVSVLLLGFESAQHPQDEPLRLALEIARGCGGEASSEKSVEDQADTAGTWRDAFFKAPYRQSALLTLGVIADTFETCCPWDAFPALHADVVRSVKAAMKEASGEKGLISCRFTHVYPDGPAPYYTWLCPGRPGAMREQWRAVKAAASEALLRHGATITHHHAVGRLHRPWYDRQRPEVFAAALRAAKGALDPAGVLNPGVLLDPDPKSVKKR